MEKEAKIAIFGAAGLVGSALVRALTARGCTRLLIPSHAELDLTDRPAVEEFFAEEQPDYVFLAAAKVGGILANAKDPVGFLTENLQIELNVLKTAAEHRVRKLLFVATSAMYPEDAEQPMKEECFLSGTLEPTKQSYTLAKIVGTVLCQLLHDQHGANFIVAVAPNLYGTHDRFDEETAHALPAMLHRFHEAKMKGLRIVSAWGSGNQRREYLLSDDFAEACLMLMDRYDERAIINVGAGEDIAMRDLANMIAKIVGFTGEITWDTSKPEGTPVRLLESHRIQALGWHPRTPLEAGIKATYAWFLEHHA